MSATAPGLETSPLAPATLAPHEDQEQRLAELLAVGRALLEAVPGGQSEGSLLQMAVESATRLLRSKYGAIGILDENDRYKHFVYTGVTPEQAALIGSPPRGLGLLGQVIQEKRPLRLDHLRAVPRTAGFPIHHPSMDSLLAVPLFGLGRPYGRLHMCDKTDGTPYSSFDELLASHFAQYLSFALERGHEIELFREKEADYLHGVERYRLLLDMAPGAVLVVQDGIVMMANVPAMRLVGAKLMSDVVGHPVEDFLDPDSVPLARERMVQTLTQQRMPKVELRIRRFDGVPGWVEIEGARISYRGRSAILSVARDITNEKQESARIRVLHEFTETINRAASSAQVFDAALDTLRAATHIFCSAILLFNEKEVLRFAAWNGLPDAFCAAADGLMPWTPDTLPATPVILPDPEREPVVAKLHPPLREQGVASVAFIPVAHQSRLLGTFLLCYRERYEPNVDEIHLASTVAEQVGVAVVRQWAAERLSRLNAALEDRLRWRTRQLEEVNKELEAFAYSVSHDLRAPLRALNGYSHILLEDYAEKLDATGNHYFERIIAASRRMEHLIDDLLRLSGVNRTQVQPRTVNLSDMAADIVGKLRESGPDRRADVMITPDMTAEADPGLIRIVLENLLSNAWKYTGRRADAHIEFGSTEVQGKNAYFVADNGAGFDMAYAGKLFAPFQRPHAPSQFDGTGIGLALVSRIVRRMGGRVWANARPCEGATFYFTLWEDGSPEELRR